MILKRFFKQKWQHADPTVRKQSISKLDANNSEHIEILKQLSLDKDPEVAKTAIFKITDIEVLNVILAHHKKPQLLAEVIDALLQQITAVLDGSIKSSLSEASKIKIIKNCRDQSLLQHLSSHAAIKNFQSLALKQIDSEERLEKIVEETQSSQLRLTAIERIHDIKKLQRLDKQLRNKDKSAHRLIKQRLKANQDKQLLHEKNLTSQQNILNSIDILSHKAYFPQFPQKRALLETQWNNLDDQYRSEELESRFQRANQLCLEIQQEQQIKQQREQEVIAANEELTNACRCVEDSLEVISTNIQETCVDIPVAKALLKTQQIRWESASEIIAPDPGTRKHFETLTAKHKAAIESYQRFLKYQEELTQLLSRKKTGSGFEQLKTLLGLISWPADLASPDAVNQAQLMLGERKAFLKGDQPESKQKLQAIQQQLTELCSAIENGSLKTANKIYRHIDEAKKQGLLDTNKNALRQFKQLGKELKELNDWQGFSSTQKKEELCEKMETLAEHHSDPDDKAKQIKILQEQWKKSGKSSDQALWARFRAAADAAYEPCKAYFTHQAEQRRNNLREREIICQQLEEFLEQNDWTNTNWPATQEILQAAKSQWKQYSPVERVQGNLIQKRFNDLVTHLDLLIKEEQKRNIVKKEALIDKAENLIDLESQQEAIEKIKQLQTEWKNIGITPRRKDEALWKKFRQHCDTLFGKRNQARREAKERRSSQISQAESFCIELERAGSSSLEALSDLSDLPKQLEKKILALTDLPKDKQLEIRKRFSNARKAFLAQLKKAELTHRNSQLLEVRKLAVWLDQLSTDNRYQLNEEQARSTWEVYEKNIPSAWLTSFSEQFMAFLKSGSTAPKQTSDEVEQAKDKLCIRMEVLANIESPVESQTNRMSYQVELLAKKMKSSSDDSPEDKENEATVIELEWLSLPLFAEHKALESRFTRAREELWKQLLSSETNQSIQA